MNAGFDFLSHERFTSLLPQDRIAYLDRAVLELEHLYDRDRFLVRSDDKTLVWQIPPELESYL